MTVTAATRPEGSSVSINHNVNNSNKSPMIRQDNLILILNEKSEIQAIMRHS
jgi:hypothetical protein